MSSNFPFPPLEPPASEEGWEAAWAAAVQQAREYGWPDEAIRDFLLSNHVSYAERVESVRRSNELRAEGRWSEALREAKRTRLREPGPPEWVQAVHGAKEAEDPDESPD